MFCKPDLCLILGLIVLAWTMLDLTWGQLIRPVYIYGGLIKSIRNYFNNTCVILLHNPNPIETQGENNEAEYCEYSIEMTDAIGRSYILKTPFVGLESEDLVALQKYLSMTHFIRTDFMDFHMFRTRVSI